MGLDASWLLNRAHILIGTPVTGEVDMMTDDLMRCLEEVTLPIFSAFFPREETIVVDTNRDRAYEDRDGIYVIRAQEGGTDLVGVSKIIDFEYDHFHYHPVVQNPFDLIAMDHAVAATRGPSTFKFSPPNILEVFPKFWNTYRGNLLVKCKFVHFSNLQSVPMGAMETLKDLYLGDVATDVLSQRRYFSTLQTTHGEIELNLERLERAMEKRDEVVEKLRLTQHMTPTSRRIYVA